MEGKGIFTASEIEILRLLVKNYHKANDAVDRKDVRVNFRKIGFYVSDFGIQNINPQIFEELIKSGKISVFGTSSKFNETTKREFVKEVSLNQSNIKESIDHETALINGIFKTAGIIDKIVPPKKGFYCIKLASEAKLPIRFQSHLDTRKNNILYIGKAEGQTLRKRFLGQELRAEGHGTFFRSIGAVLGYLPEKGSLLAVKNKNNFTFKPSDKSKIIEWINKNLEVNWIEYNGDFSIEKVWISKYCPLLNDTHNPKKLIELREVKAYCRAIANS